MSIGYVTESVHEFSLSNMYISYVKIPSLLSKPDIKRSVLCDKKRIKLSENGYKKE